MYMYIYHAVGLLPECYYNIIIIIYIPYPISIHNITIILTIAHAITDRTHTMSCKSIDYCPNCTLKCCTNEKITRERCAMQHVSLHQSRC